MADEIDALVADYARTVALVSMAMGMGSRADILSCTAESDAARAALMVAIRALQAEAGRDTARMDWLDATIVMHEMKPRQFVDKILSGELQMATDTESVFIDDATVMDV